MEKWKTRTKVVMAIIVLLIVAVLIYDVIAIHYGGVEASISSIIIVASHSNPFVVFCITAPISFLFGHLFWRVSANKDTIKSGIDKIN